MFETTNQKNTELLKQLSLEIHRFSRSNFSEHFAEAMVWLGAIEVTIDVSRGEAILIGGIPTPLKNDGLRQLGWLSHIWNGKIWKVV